MSHRALIGVLPLLAACGDAPAPSAPERIAFGGEAFGTGWGVIVTPRDGATPEVAALRAAVEARLAEIDAGLSTWREDSEISRFNRLPVGGTLELGRDFRAVLEVSRQVFEATDGAFDPTVGPLVDAWGFGAGGDRSAPPPEAERIETLRATVGLDRAVERDGRLERTAAVELDLSGVAKGHAVDALAEALEAQGLYDYFVEIGGEVRVRGTSPRGTPWRVGINRPTDTADGANAVEFALELDAGAVATSGDYRNYRELADGRRVAHTIDPRSGRPVEHPPASVTVLAPTCAAADAWATALTVLGPERGLALVAGRPELEAAFLLRGEDGVFERRTTPGLEARLLEPPR